MTEGGGGVRISSAVELRAFVLRLIDEYESQYKNELDEYLRSILRCIRNHRHDPPSYDLLAIILKEGFFTPPLAFELEWLNRVQPPKNQWWLPHPEFSKPTVRRDDLKRPDSAFKCLEETLLFQIAELRRFSEKKPEDYGQYAQYARDYKYHGLESSTGNTWYNWDPFTYLECAMAGFISLLEADQFRETTMEKCNWAALAAVLELGRSYE